MNKALNFLFYWMALETITAWSVFLFAKMNLPGWFDYLLVGLTALTAMLAFLKYQKEAF